MALGVTTSCRLRRGGILTCGGEACGVCQYCARPFCDRHGVILEDGQEVCARSACIAKRDDVERHLAYRERVLQRNRYRVCGEHDCHGTLGGQCSRCRGLFCRGHVFRREDTFLQNRVRVRQMATLCHHCWARRPIWIRT